jgi:hypothetical protein
MIEIHPVTAVMYPSLLPAGQDAVPDTLPVHEIVVFDGEGRGTTMSGTVREPHVVFVGNDAVLLIEP